MEPAVTVSETHDAHISANIGRTGLFFMKIKGYLEIQTKTPQDKNSRGLK